MKEGECIAQLPLITIDDHGNENLRKIQVKKYLKIK